jgi:hypothetical protein
MLASMLLKEVAMVVQKPRRSKVVHDVGVFIIWMGILTAVGTFWWAAEVFPLTRLDVLPFVLSFTPALVFCVIGIGTLLHMRWALFAWLGLTALTFVGLLAELFVSAGSSTVPVLFGIMFIVVRAITTLVMIVPAYLLWKRRNFFTHAPGAAAH